MYKYLKISLLIFSVQTITAQVKRVEDFNIILPEYKMESNYRQLQFIETRNDTVNYGIVQKGAFNKRAAVLPTIPFEKQFQNVFSVLKSKENVATDTLLIQLRDLKFAEVTGAFSETGYFFLRANAYAKAGAAYYLLNTVDIAEEVSGMDVTQKNYKNASRIINKFISQSMSGTKGEAPALTYAQILDIEKYEKANLPLYANTGLIDGFYGSFNAFQEQKPSVKNTRLVWKKNKIKDIEFVNYKGEYSSLNPPEIYAVVENGKGYIHTEYGFYELARRDNDYYYTGKVRSTADNGSVIAATVMFGVIGGLIASNNTDVYEVKIDYLNGSTIQVKKIKN